MQSPSDSRLTLLSPVGRIYESHSHCVWDPCEAVLCCAVLDWLQTLRSAGDKNDGIRGLGSLEVGHPTRAHTHTDLLASSRHTVLSSFGALSVAWRGGAWQLCCARAGLCVGLRNANDLSCHRAAHPWPCAGGVPQHHEALAIAESSLFLSPRDGALLWPVGGWLCCMPSRRQITSCSAYSHSESAWSAWETA